MPPGRDVAVVVHAGRGERAQLQERAARVEQPVDPVAGEQAPRSGLPRADSSRWAGRSPAGGAGPRRAPSCRTPRSGWAGRRPRSRRSSLSRPRRLLHGRRLPAATRPAGEGAVGRSVNIVNVILNPDPGKHATRRPHPGPVSCRCGTGRWSDRSPRAASIAVRSVRCERPLTRCPTLAGCHPTRPDPGDRRRALRRARVPRRLRGRPRRRLRDLRAGAHRHFRLKDAMLAEMLVSISQEVASRSAAPGRPRRPRGRPRPARAGQLAHRLRPAQQGADRGPGPRLGLAARGAREQVRGLQREYVDLWTGQPARPTTT